MKENKSLLIVVIAVSTLLVAIVGASFAFFAANITGNGSNNVTVTTSTLDSLVYTAGNAISFIATQQNFYEGAPSLYGESTSTVALTANNQESATYCYTVDLVITSNNFVYSTEELTPEIVYSVSKSLAGGSYFDIITNADITNTTGTIHIPTAFEGTVYSHVISASTSNTTTDSIKIRVSMINLETNQETNEGKNFAGQLKFTTIQC